jgi:HSP20 family molecular chaperone IbpA
VKQQEQQAILPAVDIFENESGITVQADMPGVSKDRLDVHIDSDTLSIEGRAVIPMPEGMDALHADIRSTHYQRSFSLSRELDTDRIEAGLKDGVLTLRIPKREEHRPRRIEVQTG